MTDYVYSDMNPHLTLSADSAVNLVYDEDVIIQSLKTIIATVQNERVRNPIGTRLLRLLFQPIDRDTTLLLNTELREVINKYEPRVEIVGLSVVPNPDQNFYKIRIDVRIKSIQRTISFSSRIRSFATT
jgi:phage baseplate assembly protein W